MQHGQTGACLFAQDHVLDALQDGAEGWPEIGVQVPALHHQLVPGASRITTQAVKAYNGIGLNIQ